MVVGVERVGDGADDGPRRGSRRSRGSRRRTRLPAGAFVARPAEVLDDAVGRETTRLISSQSFQPTSPTQTSFVPGRTRHAERVAQAVGDDAVVGGRRAAVQGLSGSAAPVSGSSRSTVPSKSRSDRRRVRGPDCGARRPRPTAALRAADAARRIAARVERHAVLAVVDEVEARAVAAADVERAVGAEVDRADRVARELLAPVLDQHLLGPVHDVAATPSAARAARRRRSRRPWRPAASARSVVRRSAPPAALCRRSARRACRGRRRTASREVRDAAPARAARDPRSCARWSQIGERRRGRVGEVVEHLDQTALLGDEHAPVGRERRPSAAQAAEDGALLEPGLQGLSGGARGGRKQ